MGHSALSTTMASTSLQVAGLASGFDWKVFVDQIMAVEHAPADRLALEQTKNTEKNTLLGTLGGKLTVLQTASTALSTTGLFGRRSAASLATTGGWPAAAGTGTVAGNYLISVTRLAAAAKRQGALDIGSPLSATSDVSGLTIANLAIGTAVTAGTFTVNGAKVTVALTDSLQDVFSAISTATGGTVTASYDSAADKISLSGGASEVVLGAANDTSNFLRALKLGANGTPAVSSSAKLGGVKTGAALISANLAAPITGVDGAGASTFLINGVSVAYNVNTDTVSSLLSRINQSTAGVTATYDRAADRTILTNNTTGDVGIALSENAGGILAALGLTTGGTSVRGENAEFTVNGGDPLTSQSNTLDETALGIAGLSVTVNSAGSQTIAIKSDTTAMRAKIDSFITAYNDVQQFIESSTKVTSTKGKVTSAALANNREIQNWSRELRSTAFGAVSGITGNIARLENLGIDFKSASNDLEIKDSTKLDAALSEKSADVTAFFQTTVTGFGAKFTAYATKVAAFNTGQQTRLTKANDDITIQIANIERRLVQQRLLLESAFIAMETAQSALKSQQSALDNLSKQTTRS